MVSMWQLAVSITLCLLIIVTQATALYEDSLSYDLEPQDDVSDDTFVRETRKISMRPVPFPCNGHDHLARCLHGGRGPRKTWTKAGRFCVCLCDSKWRGPECGYSTDSLRKRYPWRKEKRETKYPWMPLSSIEN